jgi:hypothetical protein
MRWITGLLAALTFACLGEGFVLLSGDPSASVTLRGRAVSAEVLALGLVYLGLVCARLAVVCGFLDSWHGGRLRWTLALVTLCLLAVLDSFFFALRVRGLLTQRWSILQLPPEEVMPVVEAVALAPAALVYAVVSERAVRSAARRRARRAGEGAPTAPEPTPALAQQPSPTSRGPITPPLPLPAAT